ncbi:MAG: quinone-dependent dihydroorotate dehydrogenase [Gammaproteobacteria bacterium]|nr:MAG: quinone-dependent dihydroorotate dehydrogenase [Gammaproteobacteria bacterium]
MYALARPFLFCLSPETAHSAALLSLQLAAGLHVTKLLTGNVPADPVRVMGIDFPNRVGLAAGLDKNAEYVDALAALGFGFIEVGTVTPRPQPGNPKPRLFRIPEQQAIINRMGFNNGGVNGMLANLERTRYQGILGINIGKNKDTPLENALDDYVACMDGVYPYASYITVNLSSPNTPGLRDLQVGDTFRQLLEGIRNRQAHLRAQHGRHVPVAVKLAPDLSEDALQSIADTLLALEIECVIATNTTIARPMVAGLKHADETGGLSGKPVFEASTQALRVLSQALGDRIPLIGVGGITDGATAVAKREAGAALVQLYSGLIYSGPALVGEVARALAAHSR